MGEGSVKNPEKIADVVYGWSLIYTYRKVGSTSPSRFEAHAGLFRLLMKGIFDPYGL